MYIEFDCLDPNCSFEYMNVTTLETEKAEVHLKCDNCDALHKVVISVELIGLPLKED